MAPHLGRRALAVLLVGRGPRTDRDKPSATDAAGTSTPTGTASARPSSEIRGRETAPAQPIGKTSMRAGQAHLGRLG
jgi:hypothetical protein